MRHEYRAEVPDWFVDQLNALEAGTSEEFGIIEGEAVDTIDMIWEEPDGTVYADALPIVGYWVETDHCE